MNQEQGQRFFGGLLQAKQEEQNQEKMAKLKAYLQGQEQDQAMVKLQELMKNAPEGSGASIGGASYSRGWNPNALIGQGAKQANTFSTKATGLYKGINDQLDSSKSTLDNLNLGNSTGDKLALINEARLGLAGSGGRAIGQTIALLAGDPTMASDTQKAVNWLQNTPNIPTLQPAQRDAIRESVFGRLPQVTQQHQQTAAQLATLGPSLAPQSDYMGITKSYTDPVEQKISQLGAMQKEYQTGRAKMVNQPPVSTPTTSDQNPSTLDKIKSFLQKGAPAQQPQAQAAQDPIAAELAKRMKNQPQAPQGQ